MTKQHCLAFVLFAGLLTPGVAQVTQPSHLVAGDTTRLTEWPGPAFDAAVLGDFTGTLRNSLVVLRGGTLGLAFDYGRFEAFGPILTGPTGVTGLVTFPQTAQSGACDVLLVATTNGASLGIFDKQTNQFLFQSQVSLGAAWDGAHDLVARKNPSTLIHVFAAFNNSNVVLIGQRNAVGALSQTGLLQLPNPIHAIDLVDWDNDGQLEVAVATSAGVIVLEVNGVTASAPACPMPLGEMKFGVGTRAGAEEMGIVSASLVGGQGLLSAALGIRCAHTPPLALQSGAMSVSDQFVYGLAMNDIDADGTSEMLICQRGSRNPLLVRPVAGTQTRIDLGYIAATNVSHCPPLFRDLNRDGVADGLFCWDSPSGLLFVPNLVGPLATPSTQNLVQGVISKAVWTGVRPAGSLAPQVLKLTIDHAGLVGEATDLHVVIWHQAGPSGNTWPPPAINAVFNDTVKLSTLTSTAPLSIGGLQPIVSTAPDSEGTVGWWTGQDHYYIDLRFINAVTKKVTYAEIDAFTIAASHHDTEGELPPLWTHLDSLQTAPGKVSWHLPITHPTPGTNQPLHAPIGGIRVRILIPTTTPLKE